MATSDVSELCAPDRYRERQPRLFQSEGSLVWYLRQHRRELIAAGALLLHAGRWYIHASRFDEYVLAAGAEAARRKVAA